MPDNDVRGSMIVCEKCRTVIWAYDEPTGFHSGIANMLRLTCPQCGAVQSFDSWTVYTSSLETWDAHSVWGAMHKIAESNNYRWNPSGDNTWSAP